MFILSLFTYLHFRWRSFFHYSFICILRWLFGLLKRAWRQNPCIFLGGRSAPKTAGRGPTTRSLVFYSLNHAGPDGRCMHIYSARQTADGRTTDGRTHGRRQTDARTARTARTHARQTDARTRTAGADRLPDPSYFTTRYALGRFGVCICTGD